MHLTKLHIKNFKSFKDETIIFDKLNVLVGANASGKSNLISIFRFINNIIDLGIENAISLAGGMEYMLNTTISKSEPLYICFSLDFADDHFVRNISEINNLKLRFSSLDYEFEITPHKRGKDFTITKDRLQLNCFKEKDKVLVSDESYVSIYERKGKKVRSRSINKINALDKKTYEELNNNMIPNQLVKYLNDVMLAKELILKNSFFLIPIFIRFENLALIYDFDTKAMKKTFSLTPSIHLEEDGSNIAGILQELLKNKDKKRKLVNLLSDCLPFVQNISTEYNFDQSITYMIKEKYSSKPLYANFLSDGTVNVVALIVALYFERNNGIIILEEPERNLHPYLMSRLIDMAKECSNNTQIIITTHTPELVKYSAVSTILLAQRDSEGFTKITKPVHNKIVNTFLDNQIGIDELFVQNMLGE